MSWRGSFLWPTDGTDERSGEAIETSSFFDSAQEHTHTENTQRTTAWKSRAPETSLARRVFASDALDLLARLATLAHCNNGCNNGGICISFRLLASEERERERASVLFVSATSASQPVGLMH